MVIAGLALAVRLRGRTPSAEPEPAPTT
jgi:hypothetical protein